MASSNLVLRTIYIDPEVDNALRTEAFDMRTSKNDLVRKYLRLGMEAAKNVPPTIPAVAPTSPKGKVTVRATTAGPEIHKVTPAGSKKSGKPTRATVAEAE